MDLGKLGRGIRALRRKKGWRQQDLAEAAEVSRSQVGRVERGQCRSIQLWVVDRIATELGASVDMRLRWQGEGLDRLLDEEHAGLVERLVVLLRALGWDVAVEVSFSHFGERGTIDVLGWHAPSRTLAVFEVKSVTPDMQAMLGGLDRKARLGPGIARDRGWNPVAVARILVLGDTPTNRRRLATHGSTVAVALPARTRETRRWLAAPVGTLSGVLFMSNGRRTDAARGGRARVRVPKGLPRTGD